MEARRISQDTESGSPIAVDPPLPGRAARSGLKRVCCAVTHLAQALNPDVPRTGTELWPQLESCHCGASRNKESLWGSGCGGS